MRTADEIVQSFVDNNFQHMKDIPNNRVFYTDNTASTLAWVENNVVIEYYFLFPNKSTPMHSHPFANQIVFIGGDLVAKLKFTPTSDEITIKLTNDDIGQIRSVTPINTLHGFDVGPAGAIIYNIQRWPDTVTNPSSAAMIYDGESMGPLHNNLMTHL